MALFGTEEQARGPGVSSERKAVYTVGEGGTGDRFNRRVETMTTADLVVLAEVAAQMLRERRPRRGAPRGSGKRHTICARIMEACQELVERRTLDEAAQQKFLKLWASAARALAANLDEQARRIEKGEHLR